MSRTATLGRLFAGAIICLSITLPPAQATPVLQGSATFNIANDLTVVDDGTVRFEFLDVSVTQGMSVAGALATYGGAGFHWATGAEVAALYSAFGIIYESLPTTYVTLTATPAETGNLVSYIGTTIGDAALGWIDDHTTSTRHTYSCMGPTTCTPASFVESTLSFWPSNDGVGVYLVRERTVPIPEPGVLGLLAIGLLACWRVRRTSDKLRIRDKA